MYPGLFAYSFGSVMTVSQVVVGDISPGGAVGGGGLDSWSVE